MTTEAEVGVMQVRGHEPRKAGGPQKLENVRKQILLRIC